MQLIASHNHTLAVVAGEGWKTARLQQTILMVIVVTADSSDTVFDVIIENEYGDEVFDITDCVGSLVEYVNIPFARAGTIKIKNSTNDENFNITLTVKEN